MKPLTKSEISDLTKKGLAKLLPPVGTVIEAGEWTATSKQRVVKFSLLGKIYSFVLHPSFFVTRIDIQSPHISNDSLLQLECYLSRKVHLIVQKIIGKQTARNTKNGLQFLS